MEGGGTGGGCAGGCQRCRHIRFSDPGAPQRHRDFSFPQQLPLEGQ